MNNEFHQQYLEEAREVLHALEQSLVQFEKSSGVEELNNVYRFLHTLKGSAGMFGFSTVEKLSHELESVFQDIRDGIRQFDSFIFDLTLHAVDVLMDLINGKDVSKEADSIITSIKGLNIQSTEILISRGRSAAGETRCFAILFKPEPEIFKRGVNVEAIICEIQELGQTEMIIHNEIVPIEKQFAEKTIVSWFEIFVSSDKSCDDVNDIFFFLKEAEYKVIQATSPGIFSDEEYRRHIVLNQDAIQERVAILNSIHAGWGVETRHDTPAGGSEREVPETEGSTEVDNSSTIIRKPRKGGHVNVAAEKLDHLINIVSELVIFRTEMQHLMEDSQNPAVIQALEKLERLTLGLRDSAFNIRLVPLSVLNVKLQRLVRSVSNELGKEVEFITEGLDTELDRGMIGALEAPLMHLIRNAIDHGIETPQGRLEKNKPAKGLVKLFSYNSGDHVFIQLQDDGNGIDFDKIREKGIAKGLLNANSVYSEKELINVMMMPGFSTAEKLTTVSGRGVGMDVVKKEINALRGDIEVSTEKGLGSIFTLRLPLTLTVLDTLVVKVHDNKFLLPINEVEHCFTEDHEKLFYKKSRQINYGGQLLPFVSLREQFNIEANPGQETVIVVNKNDRRIAVVVDKIVGTLQTVYKPLNDLLHQADCFSGASILGDGSMALIINPLKLKG
jgi:two-component system, chemotaxis family, sensor kinase CheA